MFQKKIVLTVWGGLAVCLFLFLQPALAERSVTDAAGRTVTLPDQIERVICSGPGCLRLLTYFKAQDLVVAVDDIESRNKMFDARPYALVNPAFKTKPIFGGFRGQDDPEKILGLEPQPQVIFKTYPTMGHDPVELESKTGIPVITLEYGDLGAGKKTFYKTLTIMGQALNRPERTIELTDFFDREIDALAQRTRDIKDPQSCFIGGIAFKGPHGFQSTEPSYPPFLFVHANNIANTGSLTQTSIRHSSFSKEQILAADPGVLFLDLSTLQLGDKHSGLNELKTDPVYQALTAVQQKKVYALLPYNWYTENFGSILANAWYIGKQLYPENFEDIDPVKKADDIYSFLLSSPAYEKMNALFENKAFKPVSLTP